MSEIGVKAHEKLLCAESEEISPKDKTMEDKKIEKEVISEPIVCQTEIECQTSEEVMAKKTLRPIYEKDSM